MKRIINILLFPVECLYYFFMRIDAGIIERTGLEPLKFPSLKKGVRE